MQSPAVETPSSKERKDGAGAKTSGKKLVQARLPFKILVGGKESTPVGKEEQKSSETTPRDGRKRRLSFEGSGKECETGQSDEIIRGRSASKENLAVNAKKKKMIDEPDVVVMDDDDIIEDEEDIVMKSYSTKVNETKQIIKPTVDNKEIMSPKTPKQTATKKERTTRSSSGSVKNKAKPKNTPGDSASKVQIKLPIGSVRSSKRRKSKLPQSQNESTDDEQNNTCVVSSEDADTYSNAENPEKRQKVDDKDKKSKTPESKVKEKEVIELDDSSEASVDASKNEKLSESPKGKKRSILPDIFKPKAKNTPAKVKSAEPKETNSKQDARRKSPVVSKAKENINKKNNIESKNQTDSKLKHAEKTSPKSNKKTAATHLNDEVEKTHKVSDQCTENMQKGTSKEKTSPKGNGKTTATPLTDEAEKTDKILNQSTEKTKNRTNKGKTSPKGHKKTIVTQLVDEAEKFNNNSSREKSSPKNSNKTNASALDIEAEKTDIASDQCTEIILSSSDSSESASASASASASVSTATPLANTARQHSRTSEVKAMESPNTNSDTQKKSLTPKQQRLMEQRRKAREEKERRLQEERLQKQREKEAKELLRKRDREERDEHRRKEREERDELKRKEREEKERKRLAEVEAKNEEKRKRTEAKEEELRKKEEERKRKEQEKEEADLKKKKTAEAFQNYFKPKHPAINAIDTKQENVGNTSADSNNAIEMLAFRPFEVKGDMKLAPIRRRKLSFMAHEELDAYFCKSDNNNLDNIEEIPRNELYIAQLKSGKVTPSRWRQPSLDSKDSDDDVQILEDDLERAGQAIVEETHGPIERFRTKFYKFWENQRPPYYGTWTKKTNVITPRRPFAQDTKFFDYEVDSDLEWEEEEPGESLDGSDEDKEKESEDDDYEVDNEWFVPHGHLSEEELQNDDDAGDANTREAQKVKLQVLQQEFAQEMKKKTEKIKPRLIGCIWLDENGNQPQSCPKIIWDTLHMRAMWCTEPPMLEDPEIPEKTEPGSPSTNGVEKTTEKAKPLTLTDELLKNLVQLVHGNGNSKNIIIKNFLSYLETNEDAIKSGKARLPPKTLVREKIDDFAEWTIVESKVSHSNKKKNKKRLCWVVSADVLKKMDLEGLDIHNKWNNTSESQSADAEATTPAECTADGAKSKSEQAKTETKSNKKIKAKKKVLKKLVIIEKEAKESKTTELALDKPNADNGEKPQTSGKTSSNTSKAAASTAPVVKKRVPLLMSVARGQQIPQPAKNALISAYLNKNTVEEQKADTKTTLAPTADVIVLE